MELGQPGSGERPVSEPKILVGSVFDMLPTLPSDHFHSIVTSPPYWRLRNYESAGQLGLEPTIEAFVENTVIYCRELMRVLRPDGIFWLNLGSSYAADPTTDGSDFDDGRANRRKRTSGGVPSGFKRKDLIGVPWIVALALQKDGWYLRSEVIWQKASPMPESCKDRPTRSHEHVFMLTKSPNYYFDHVGAQEECTGGAHTRGKGTNPKAMVNKADGDRSMMPKQNDSFSKNMSGLVERRNARSVWKIASYSLKMKHFAAFPPELVRRCLAGTVGELGTCCGKCGKQPKRKTKAVRVPTRPGTNSKIQRGAARDGSPYDQHSGSIIGNRDRHRHVTHTETIGWTPSCKCDGVADVRCRVLDCFHGAGTTMKVCERFELEYTGIEINQEYVDSSMERPDVVFPHERKAKRIASVKPKNNGQMELDFA